MSVVIAGVLVDHLGLAQHVEAVQTPSSDPLSFRTRKVFSALPAEEVGDEQPSWIPIDRSHDGHPVGVVQYLERSGGGSIWMVGRVDQPIRLEGMSLSGAFRRGSTGRGWAPADPWTITAVSLTTKPAMSSLGTIEIIDADNVDRIDETLLLRTRTHNAHLAALLGRAKTTARSRARGAPVVVYDVDQRRAEQRADRKMRELELIERQLGALGQRTGGDRPAGALWHSQPYPGILSVR